MKYGITALLLSATILSIAAGDQPAPGKRAWQLTGDGVMAGTTAVPIPGWIRAAEPYACPPELAVGPKGEAVVTSNVVSTLWRIDPQTLAVTEHPLALDADAGRDIGFSSLVYSPRHAAYFAVSAAHGSLWRIDTQLQRARKLGSTFSKEDLPCATN
jgi:hypothetical protein